MSEQQAPSISTILFVPIYIVLIMWLSHLFEWMYAADWAVYGIYPRILEGLPGVLITPFLHSDLSHLLSNTIPMLLLGSALFFFYRGVAYPIYASLWITTGLLSWLIARPAWHIGASGIVYALASFLFFSGMLRKVNSLLALSLAVLFLYYGLIFGISPQQIDISWESHLAGAIAGFVFAVIYRKKGPQDTHYDWENEEDNYEELIEELPNQEENPQQPVKFIYTIIPEQTVPPSSLPHDREEELKNPKGDASND